MPAAGSSRKRRHGRTAGLPTRKAAKGGDSRRMRAVLLHETDGLGSSDAGGRPAGPAVMSRSSHAVTSSVRVIRSPTLAAGAMTATRAAQGANMWPAGR
jgi:hypothetical protein